MTTKIKVLIGVIAAQLAFIFFSLTGQPEAGNRPAAQGAAFAITADSASVDKLVFGKNVLQRQRDQWTINATYPADPRLIRQLLDLMRKIEIKRPVADQQRDSVGKMLASQGANIQVYANGQRQNQYQIVGQGPDTYAQLPGQAPVSLFLPGHNLVLHEIFTMPEGEWRNKTIIATGFTSLRELWVRYPANPADDFHIRRDSGFYHVEGIKELDSAMVFNYLNAYQSVNVLAFLDNIKLRDSLGNVPHFAQLEVMAINERNDQTILIYVNRQRMLGVLTKTQEVVALDPRYFTRFLVRKRDFGK
jgi:hypothetical protein